MLSSKHSASILIGLLVIALLCAVFVYVILPKRDEVGGMERSVAILEQEISLLQSSIASQQQASEYMIDNQFIDQKKLPLHKDIATLLLNVEEVEIISNSRINKIEFNNYDATVRDSLLQEPTGQLSAEALALDAMASNSEASVIPISPIAKDMLPPQLQMVTLSIDMSHSSQQSLFTFLKELEALERVVRIDRIDYDLPGEIASYDTDERAIAAQVQVTAFYYVE